MEEYCKIKSGQAWDLLSSPKSSFCGSRSTIYSIPRLACYSHSPDLLECKLRMSSRRAAKPFSQQSQTQASGGGRGTGGRLLCSLFLLSPPSSPAPHSGSVCSVGSPDACQLQPFLSALAHVYPHEAWAGRLAPPRSPFSGLRPLGALNLDYPPAHIQCWSTPPPCTGPHSTGYHFALLLHSLLGTSWAL